MHLANSEISARKLFLLGATMTLASIGAFAADEACAPTGGFSFMCGLANAEDLVPVPGTSWIIASHMTPAGGLSLIDAKTKTVTKVDSSGWSSATQDNETYAECPGVPNSEAFLTHGLNMRAGRNGHSALYVVGHGGREAIEVFDVDATGTKPMLTWTGCVVLPAEHAANSVASLADGSLLITIPLDPGKDINSIMTGEPSGAVFEWSPGEKGFTRVEGTGLPYGNGIEVSADGKEFYVASSGLFNVTAFSNTNPANKLRTSDTFEFLPDNLHMGSDGRLITAGLVRNDSVCGNVLGSGPFDFGAFMTCPRPFIVRAIDPVSMQGEDIVRGPAIEKFSNITMGLPVGDELWIGSFASDRLAYTKLK